MPSSVFAQPQRTFCCSIAPAPLLGNKKAPDGGIRGHGSLGWELRPGGGARTYGVRHAALKLRGKYENEGCSPPVPSLQLRLKLCPVVNDTALDDVLVGVSALTLLFATIQFKRQ